MQNSEMLSHFPLPTFDAGTAAQVLSDVIREETLKTGMKSVILGLSGGIDSAVAAALAVRALGSQYVLVVSMPYKSSNPDSLRDAESVAEYLGLDLVRTEITPMVDAYAALRTAESDAVPHFRLGNIMARMRMIVLYDLSARYDAMVLGTSNKTEILLGYSTLWGDSASGFNPLGDLYKFQVRALASELGLPEAVLTKPPSADLWEGQSDEAELNMSYEVADRLLYALVDRCFPPEYIRSLTGNSPDFENLFGRVVRNQYKRRMPMIAKISERTVNREFRYPRDWNS